DAAPGAVAFQDTTEVNWTSLRATTGLCPLGHTACRGLFVHSTLALTPARGPVGLLAQQVWARDANEGGTRARRKQRPITQKESHKWLWRLEAGCKPRHGCPQTLVVSGGGRETALSDGLAAERPAGVELVLRAAWNRCVSAAQHSSWAPVEAQPVRSTLVLHRPRRSTQPARAAELALRAWRVTWGPPRH